MTIDTTRLGQFVAKAMDSLEENLPDASLGEIMLVVELHYEHPEEGPVTEVRTACTDQRVWIQRGLLAEAKEATEA